jgi:GTP-binding protein EngB required for normal cell division
MTPLSRSGVPLDTTRPGPPAFVIVGKTGSGKTTLLNSLFGYDVGKTGTTSDVTLGVTQYILPRTGVTIYDTPGAGGLDDRAEESMKRFLHLTAQTRPAQIPADFVLFLFSHERIARFDLEFFSLIDAVFGPRILVVKNYKADATEEENIRNAETIEARCGRKPVSVDARTGTGVDGLVAEILRFLPAERLIAFNESMLLHRQRAGAMARSFAIKYASVAAVTSAEKKAGVSRDLKVMLEEMRQGISRAYIADMVLESPTGDVPVTQVKTDTEAAGRFGGGAIIGGIIGILGGPIGALFGAFLGGLIGAGTTPQRVRGGAAAVVEFLTYARVQAALMDEALKSPTVALTRGSKQTQKWLKARQAQYRGLVSLTRDRIWSEIRGQALESTLNNPTLRSPADVERMLRPVVDSIFNARL